MIKLTGGATDCIINEEKSYLLINSTLYIFSVDPDIVDFILQEIDDGNMKPKYILIYQLDIFLDISKFKEGLSKIFDYIIFKNQDFISDSDQQLTLITPTDEFLTEAKNQIVVSQKKITKLSYELFPKVEIADIIKYTEKDIHFSISLYQSRTECESLFVDINYDKEENIIVDTPILEKTTPEMNYVNRKIYEHHYIDFGVNKSKANFYGGAALIKSKMNPAGTIIVDTYKLVSDEEVMIPNGTSSTEN